MAAPPLAYLSDFPAGPAAGTRLDIDPAMAAGTAVDLTLGTDGTDDDAIRLLAVMSTDGLKLYLNRCPHFGTALNEFEPSLWDHRHRFLLCQTHGALFDPATGLCRRGPCKGDHLRAVAVRVSDDGVYTL